MTRMKLNDDGVCNLIEAIVDLAKCDYQKALSGGKNTREWSEYESVTALEAFFHSEWFQQLTNYAMSGEEAIALARRGEYA